LRRRQTPLDQAIPKGTTSSRQKSADITAANSTVPGLQNIPSNYFEPGTVGYGLNGTGLLKSRPNIEVAYKADLTKKGAPLLNKIPTNLYYFVEYSNPNTKGISSLLKSFSVVKTLNETDLKTFSQMLGAKAKTITPIDKYTYDNGSFTHPKYLNDDGQPLIIRYAEIAIVKQVTAGRLDNAPIGYPDFDSTPDGVINMVSPIPGAPYTEFTAIGITGATFNVNAGGTVAFKSLTPKTPWQTAPTGWKWSFGVTASPTGSTLENPIITYGTSGAYSVTLTTSNGYGSKTLTKNNFIIVK